jgi:hypothetical protein
MGSDMTRQMICQKRKDGRRDNEFSKELVIFHGERKIGELKKLANFQKHLPRKIYKGFNLVQNINLRVKTLIAHKTLFIVSQPLVISAIETKNARCFWEIVVWQSSQSKPISYVEVIHTLLSIFTENVADWIIVFPLFIDEK